MLWYVQKSIISTQTQISEKFIIILFFVIFIIFRYLIHWKLKAHCGEHRLKKRPWRIYIVLVASSFYGIWLLFILIARNLHLQLSNRTGHSFTFHCGLFLHVQLMRCIFFHTPSYSEPVHSHRSRLNEIAHHFFMVSFNLLTIIIIKL